MAHPAKTGGPHDAGLRNGWALLALGARQAVGLCASGHVAGLLLLVAAVVVGLAADREHAQDDVDDRDDGEQDRPHVEDHHRLREVLRQDEQHDRADCRDDAEQLQRAAALGDLVGLLLSFPWVHLGVLVLYHAKVRMFSNNLNHNILWVCYRLCIGTLDGLNHPGSSRLGLLYVLFIFNCSCG